MALRMTEEEFGALLGESSEKADATAPRPARKARARRAAVSSPVVVDELHEAAGAFRPVEFFVNGLPKTKGSIRAFLPKGWTRPILTSDTKGLKPWQKAIATEARAAMGGRARLRDCAVSVALVFRMPKPKKVAAGRPDDRPIVRPDLDKMVRAVYDSLKGVVWEDDCQVTESRERKRYAEHGSMGVLVRVSRDEEA